jgi:hypothetical protein
MSDTTNISDLPTAQLSNNTSNNVLLEKTELPKTNTKESSVSITKENIKVPNIINDENKKRETELNNNLQPNVMNELVNGLQQASMKGMTSLPSRDIPRDTNHITQDETTKPNYIPKANNFDYISEHEKKEDIINKHMTNTNKQDTFDYLFEELQTPVLISLLYYLFKQPFIEKLLLKYFPVFFKKSGHFKWYGSLIMSLLFGATYYSFNTFFNHLSIL